MPCWSSTHTWWPVERLPRSVGQEPHVTGDQNEPGRPSMCHKTHRIGSRETSALIRIRWLVECYHRNQECMDCRFSIAARNEAKSPLRFSLPGLVDTAESMRRLTAAIHRLKAPLLSPMVLDLRQSQTGRRSRCECKTDPKRSAPTARLACRQPDAVPTPPDTFADDSPQRC
jgi:hypothetical protein